MEELVVRLIAACRQQEAVASTTVDNGMRIFAYPLADRQVLVALGGRADTRLTGEQLLARRAARLASAGAWLPAMFSDGSLYLLRRIVGDEEQGGAAFAAQLDIAVEMLN